jgi:uncharacterized protein (TIGR03790 family)
VPVGLESGLDLPAVERQRSIVTGRKIIASLILLGLVSLLPARAEDLAARLVIVANSRQPESVALAQYYAGRRGVPAANIVALPFPEEETVSRREFNEQVWQPVQDELYRRGWIEGTASSLVDRFGRKRYAFATQNISYLVTCRGVPLRVANDAALVPADSKFAAQFNRNEAAVDAEFSLLATGDYDITGLLNNPLYAQDGRLSLDAAQVIKVTRLDGPTWAEARHLVDSALEGERRGLIGRYYVDLKGPHSDGDDWLGAARRQLDALGFDGDVEDTAATMPATARSEAAVFYFGWYSGQLDGPFAAPGFAFAPGAVALHIHSYSAHTLHSPTAGWSGPLVARGVAATVGNVYEPYLQLTHRPDMLLRALARGRNFGDAAYYALPVLSWQAVALGDPLYRPFHVTLEAQLARLDQLPPIAARYVLVRQANLQARQGQLPAAIAGLQAAQERRPDLVVGLELAHLLVDNRDPAGALAALAFVRRLSQFAAGDWAVVRAIAQFLSAHGDAAGAVEVYTTLLQTPALTEAEQIALLGEAQAAAVAAGNAAQAAKFGRQRAELTAPVSNVP